MPFVAIGVLLIVAKLAGLAPFDQLSWWWVALPFGLAVLWWEFADASGWTRRRVMDKMEAKKVERRERALEGLGLKMGGRRRDRLNTQHAQTKAREVSADPTHAGRGVAPKVAAQAEVDRRHTPRS